MAIEADKKVEIELARGQAREQAPRKSAKPMCLVIGLVAVLTLSVVFMGALGGWFNSTPRVMLDKEYICGDNCGEEIFIDVDAQQYEDLVTNKKSFVVLVDQTACVTADRLEEFIQQYIDKYDKNGGLRVYRIMFDDLKNTSLYDKVQFYPSLVLVSEGEAIAWLRADADEDVAMYNEYEAFSEWLGGFLGR